MLRHSARFSPVEMLALRLQRPDPAWKAWSVCLTLTCLWLGVEMFMSNISSAKLLISVSVGEEKKKKRPLHLRWADCYGGCQARRGRMSDAAVSFGRACYPELFLGKSPVSFFPDHSEMTAEKVQPIGARSSPAAPSRVIFSLNCLETIESRGWNCFSDMTAVLKRAYLWAAFDSGWDFLCILGTGRIRGSSNSCSLSVGTHRVSTQGFSVLFHRKQTDTFLLYKTHFTVVRSHA